MLVGHSKGNLRMLRPSIVPAGLDPDNLPERGGIDVATDLVAGAPRRWRDIWSAWHSVTAVSGILPVATPIRIITKKYKDSVR